VNTVQKIGNDAFLNSGITGLTFASSQNLTSIGDNAFKGCEDLAAPTLPASLTSIGAGAFEGCNGGGFDAIAIPARVASIGVDAFKDAASLETLTFTGTSVLATISESAFENTALADVELPASVVNIDSKAFAGTGATLTEITINGVLLSVAADAFPDECDKVILKATPDENMAFPVSVTKLTLMLGAGAAASNVPGVTELTLAGTSKAALSTLTGIDTLYLADGFLLSEPLTGADFGALGSLAVIELAAGSGAPLTDVYAPVGNVLYSAAPPKTLIKYPAGLEDVSYVVETNTIHIGDAAFKGANNLLATLTFNGNTVTSIGNSAFENSWVSSVTFPSSLTNIGNDAFKNTKLAGALVLGTGVTDIGTGAFAGTPITALTITGPLETLRAGALPASCVTLNLDASLDDDFVGDFGSVGTLNVGIAVTKIVNGAFDGKTTLTSLVIDDSLTGSTLATIGNNAFRGTRLTTVAFNGNALRTIGNEAFKSITTLTTLTLTNTGSALTGTVIGESAFEGCSILTAPTLTGITKIGDAAFKGCVVGGFNAITIPVSLTEIGANAFNGCTSLAGITVTAGGALAKIGDGAFVGTALTGAVNLGESPITNIGSDPEEDTPVGAFQGLAAVTGITLDNTKALDIVIGANAFKNSGLTAVPLGGDSTVIGAGAFSATKLTGTITLTGVTSIGAGAFENCAEAGFTEITIPDAVTDIEANTFSGCTNLEDLDLGTGVLRIGAGAFAGTKVAELEIKSGLRAIDATSLPNASLLPTGVALTLTANLGTPFTGSFGNISSLDMNVTTNGAISANAFANNTNLKKLTISKAATIPNGTFTGCTNLKEVIVSAVMTGQAVNNLPAATTDLAVTISIPNVMQFANANIKNLTIGDGADTATTFNILNFNKLSGLVKITFKGDGVTPGALAYNVANGSFRLEAGETDMPTTVSTPALGTDVSYGYTESDPDALPNPVVGGWAALP
jgi:hypothetical protein